MEEIEKNREVKEFCSEPGPKKMVAAPRQPMLV
jgi:hypothetical protein